MDRHAKKTKASKIEIAIKQDILSGQLKPLEKLQMEALKDRYGVGFSPLREALTRLVATGLVQSVDQCGFYVTELSLTELYDLYHVRGEIEGLALASAILNGDHAWESKIIASSHQYTKLLAKHPIDPKEWGIVHNQFRNSLVSACSSSWLLKLRSILHDQAIRYRLLCLHHHVNDKKMLKKLNQENNALLKATLARDTEKALALSKKSWDASAKSIAQLLQK